MERLHFVTGLYAFPEHERFTLTAVHTGGAVEGRVFRTASEADPTFVTHWLALSLAEAAQVLGESAAAAGQTHESAAWEIGEADLASIGGAVSVVLVPIVGRMRGHTCNMLTPAFVGTDGRVFHGAQHATGRRLGPTAMRMPLEEVLAAAGLLAGPLAAVPA